MKEPNAEVSMSAGEWAVHVFVVGAMILPLVIWMLFVRAFQVPQCEPSTFGPTFYDSAIDGKLVHVTGVFAIRAPDNRQRLVASCPKGGCTGPYRLLEQQQRGVPARAEFCGRFLTMVAVNGTPIYFAQPPDQTRLNQVALGSHVIGIVMLLLLGVLLIVPLLIRRYRAGRTALRPDTRSR